MSDATRPTMGAEAQARTRWVSLNVDPHVHSEGSYDCAVPVEDVLAAAAEAGLDALAVTDHDTIERSLRAVELAPTYGLIAVPGVEVSTADGHLLALGVEEALEPGRPLRETAAEVRSRGGATIVPHPFQRTRHGASARAIGGVDAVETYNAHTVAGVRNRQAARFAARRGYPGTGGSDAHDRAVVGQAYTTVRAVEPTAEGIVEALRAGRTRVVAGRSPPRQVVRKFARNAAIKAMSVL